MTTETAPASAPVIPSETAQGGQLTLSEQRLKAQSWSNRVYHGVLDALGGSGDVSYARDPTTGKMIATPVKAGPGTQWKRIIAGALSGFGAAAQAGGTGPGANLRAAGAGINAGLRLGPERDQIKREQANEDFEAQSKAATQQAQLALMNHQIAASTFNLGRAQVEASYEDSQRENDFEKTMIDAGDGAQDMGVFPDFGSVVKAFKEVPQLHDHQAGGRIISIPHINNEGKVDGVHAALVTPNFLESKINHDFPITVRTYRDGKVEESTFTVPAGSLTGQQYVQMLMAQSKDALEDWTKTQDTNIKKQTAASEAKLRTAEGEKDYAEAENQRQQAVLNETVGIGAVESNAEQLVEGTMDIANLSKRSKTYDTTLAAANSYSLKKYGIPFNPAKAAGDYKFATNPQTYNTLNYLNSLTGRDNASGNLGVLIDMSNKLARSTFPPLNKIELWAKLSAGNPEIAAYQGAITEVSDQIAKVLQGGGTGSATSDAKLNQAKELLDKNFNGKQMLDVAMTLRQLLANRKKEIIGDNRYLMQWHGQPGAGPTAQQNTIQNPATLPISATPPAGATHKTPGSDGKSYWTDDKGNALGVVGNAGNTGSQ